MNALFCTSADGTRIAYDVTGGGPAPMLLHGGGHTRDDWHKTGYVARLRDDFTVIALDVRGSGESDKRFEIADYAIEKVCADLYAVADACGARRFAVWGFSFGGSIAKPLGARSDRVTAVAVIGVPFGPTVDDEFGRYIENYVKRWGPEVDAFNRATASGESPPAVSEAITSGRIPVWLACFQAMRDWPRIDPGDVRCPTLLLVGSANTNTMNWVRANGDALNGAGIQVEVVEGLDHHEEFSDIDRIFPTVGSFFKQYAV